jgi:hypothetical protein
VIIDGALMTRNVKNKKIFPSKGKGDRNFIVTKQGD